MFYIHCFYLSIILFVINFFVYIMIHPFTMSMMTQRDIDKFNRFHLIMWIFIILGIISGIILKLKGI